MLYFAYGSNMDLDHFGAFLDTHGVMLDTNLDARPARLSGYRLRTNYFAHSHGAGACNIEPAPGRSVEGVLMHVTPAIRNALRIKEGYPQRYTEVEVAVQAPSGASLKAFTYIVSATQRLDIDLPVTARYRECVLGGADSFQLSNAYQKQLHSTLRAT